MADAPCPQSGSAGVRDLRLQEDVGPAVDALLAQVWAPRHHLGPWLAGQGCGGQSFHGWLELRLAGPWLARGWPTMAAALAGRGRAVRRPAGARASPPEVASNCWASASQGRGRRPPDPIGSHLPGTASRWTPLLAAGPSARACQAVAARPAVVALCRDEAGGDDATDKGARPGGCFCRLLLPAVLPLLLSRMLQATSGEPGPTDVASTRLVARLQKLRYRWSTLASTHRYRFGLECCALDGLMQALGIWLKICLDVAPGQRGWRKWHRIPSWRRRYSFHFLLKRRPFRA